MCCVSSSRPQEQEAVLESPPRCVLRVLKTTRIQSSHSKWKVWVSSSQNQRSLGIESHWGDKVLRVHSCAGPKSQGAGDGRFPALLLEDSAGRRLRQCTLRARLCCNLQLEQRFENMPKMPTCCDKLVFYGTKRPCRKAGIPLYDSNFRDRLIFYVSKRVHRKVGMFFKEE